MKKKAKSLISSCAPVLRAPACTLTVKGARFEVVVLGMLLLI